MDFDADIDVMLTGVGGVDVTFGAITGKGHFDVRDPEMVRDDGGTSRGKVKTVTVRTSKFPGLQEGSVVTVAGAEAVAQGVAGTYRVILHEQLDEGRVTRAVVA